MTATLISRISHQADWLAHRYDPAHDAVHFLHAPRAVHRAATFLTSDYLPSDLDASKRYLSSFAGAASRQLLAIHAAT